MSRSLFKPLRTLSLRTPVQVPSIIGPILRSFGNSAGQTVDQQPIYADHVSLNGFQRTFLAIGSAFASLNNPYRADMIAVLSETTGGPFLSRLRDQMLEDEGGRRLLRDRPRINTSTVDLDQLEKMPEGTFGKEYCNWLRWCQVSPDTREPVRFIDSPELAYVMQRYRECHDFYHVISGPFPVNISGEIVVKWIELANMGLPVAALSAIFGPLRLNSEKRTDLLRTYVPWALRTGSSCKPLICVEWEKNWETPIKDLKLSLGIPEPPIDFKTWMDLQRKQNSQ
ncbi:hypothetical protein MJO28_009077 [Puccinia striiformis f. sp. tritici]|uniref:Uncharacterized protein n=1 Tax=Puccinia striiformis f. sp. tritici TaxID=168172 RepID=A0ACC0E999_9BASI|nr:hypothetical protein Pst134EA_017980 [Puccinia striiformis f. sp. tritici]KAH9461692.1 hypothetical protein Pst134EA_017980 [Puccinia striiformis f. sp. tritici]KAI7947169.1 hypothetical protein MJO28_009077 [Puccinia striiformis f. sp. tritici]